MLTIKSQSLMIKFSVIICKVSCSVYSAYLSLVLGSFCLWRLLGLPFLTLCLCLIMILDYSNKLPLDPQPFCFRAVHDRHRTFSIHFLCVCVCVCVKKKAMINYML